VNRLNQEIAKVMANPETKKALYDAGVEASYAPPEVMSKYMALEYDRWGKVIKDANVTLQ
jgi:tripartite-type tricarboxylate transporter receptor subunit TctC